MFVRTDVGAWIERKSTIISIRAGLCRCQCTRNVIEICPAKNERFYHWHRSHSARVNWLSNFRHWMIVEIILVACAAWNAFEPNQCFRIWNVTIDRRHDIIWQLNVLIYFSVHDSCINIVNDDAAHRHRSTVGATCCCAQRILLDRMSSSSP